VIFNFASAEAAGGDRHIVVMNAVARQNLKTTERHKENIARPKRVKRPIVKLKTAADRAKIKKT